MPDLNKVQRSIGRIDSVIGVIRFAELVIQRKYDALGGAAFFGDIERKERAAWYFKFGCICYNSQMHDAFEIHGDIYRKWVELCGLRLG